MTGGPSPNRSNAMVVPSFERIFSTSSPLQPFDVPSDFGQIIVELVPAAIELPDGRPRESLCVQREVRERYPFVVAAVVEEHSQLFGKLPCKVCSQHVLVDLPILGTPVRW